MHHRAALLMQDEGPAAAQNMSRAEEVLSVTQLSTCFARLYPFKLFTLTNHIKAARVAV